MSLPNVASTKHTSRPNWLGLVLAHGKVTVPGGVDLAPLTFPRADQVTVTLAAGAVTAGADKTLTPTAALTGTIPSGTVLDFGDGELATLTVAALAGATTITGVTLAAAVEGGESATYLGVGKRKVLSGSFVGRTIAEREAGTGYSPATPASDEEFGLVFEDIADVEMDTVTAIVAPRSGNTVYENFLPGWTALGATTKAKIRELYICETGWA